MTAATAPTIPTADAPEADVHGVRCMEIWGGSEAADQRLSAPGLDVHVYARPYRGHQSGGDIHYLSMCGAGNISRFLLADVAGHGETVADIARDLRHLLRRHINQLDTSRLAHELNDAFSELSLDGRFATALLTTYFAPTDQLIVVNAGHPRPLWYQRESQRWQWLVHDCADCDSDVPNNLPLGLIPGTGYEQFAVTLARGDIVLLYTDSLTEARRPDGRMLGEAGLLELVQGLDVTDAPGVGPALLQHVEHWRGGAEPEDDLTLVAMHHNASKPHIPLGERLAAMAKMVGILPV